MGRQAAGGMHVDRVRSRHVAKSGETREYESRLLRRSFRKPDGKVGKEGTTVSGRYIHRHSVGHGPRAAQLGSRTPSHRRAHVQNLATKDR